VPARLLHVSDLHVGSAEEFRIEPSLAALVERLQPELIVASGDLTHRGRAEQHDRAVEFLRSFGLPLHAIPGNHDIPYTFPDRFTGTWRQFERCWETTEPVYRSDTLFVVGLNSVRAWRHQSGGIRARQLQWASSQLDEAPAGALRVVTLHHHLLGAPWRSRKKPVSRRNHVLASLVEAGAELILAPSQTDTLKGYWRVRLGAQARALENQCVVVQSPTVGEAPWSPAVDVNRGAAGVYGPPDLGFPDDGVLALGELDRPAWVHAEVDLDRVAEVRAQGTVRNHGHWPEQTAAAACVVPVSV
jgi:3',5'-cyclic AMP phosphodiesterase CpdA